MTETHTNIVYMKTHMPHIYTLIYISIMPTEFIRE